MIQIIINNIANKVRSTVLTGLNTSLTGVITATDTVLEAFGKLQKQINDKADSGAVGSSGITMATSRILGRTTAGTGAIEEISIGTGLSLSGGTLSATAVSGGITVGTTAVTSGTIGRVFFEGAGNVVQQDGGLFWDNTNKRLGVGATPATNVRLDVRAQGALSTDIAFRVRNSADTVNLVEVRGDGETRFNNPYLAGLGVFIKNAGAYGARIDFQSVNSLTIVRNDDSTASTELARGFSIHNKGVVGVATAKINNSVRSGLAAYGLGYGFNWAFTSNSDGFFSQSERAMWLTDSKSLVLYTGVAPYDIHSEKADAMEMYSADIVAGNAAPHFRTENGAIIKIYQETTSVATATVSAVGGSNIQTDDTFDGYTLAQVVRALRNHGLLA